MEQLITHACGHEQAHHLTGYASQQECKARWLRTTTCRACFIAGRKTEQAEAAQRDSAAIAHLDLPALVGSDRQIGWATTIRAGRMAALVTAPINGDGDGLQRCAAITEAKWWIDHRDLSDVDLSKASQAASIGQHPDHGNQTSIRSQAT